MTNHYTTKQVIVVRKDLNMRKGKLAAQVAHASLAFLTSSAKIYGSETDAPGTIDIDPLFQTNITQEQMDWLNNSFAKVVVSVDSYEELQELVHQAEEMGIVAHLIVDNGTTEFNNIPTATCAAFGPDLSDKLDKLTGHLKLL